MPYSTIDWSFKMKRYLALSALFIALPSYAQLAPQQGVSGEISLNVGGYVFDLQF